MVKNNEVNILSRYESQQRNNLIGDFRFVVLEKFLSRENEPPMLEKLLMNLHFWIKERRLSEEKGFGLETTHVSVEKFPLMVSPPSIIEMKRIYSETQEPDNT